MNNLIPLFQAACSAPPAANPFAATLPPWVHGGMDTRTNPREYIWRGLKRGADPRHPFVLLQCTLAGEGLFRSANRRAALHPGDTFLVKIPSAHVYQLPAHSPSWILYWISVRHPDVNERLLRLGARFGPVIHLPADSPVHLLAAQLCRRVMAQDYEDAQAYELALWEWALELERTLSAQENPPQERERLLRWTLRQWTQSGRRALSAGELARRAGMSRSAFSHHFSKVTGQPPAQHLLHLRLQEVIRCLRSSDDKLETIAAGCGFVDASHLTKAVFRTYRIKPGALRRLLRQSGPPLPEG